MPLRGYVRASDWQRERHDDMPINYGRVYKGSKRAHPRASAASRAAAALVRAARRPGGGPSRARHRTDSFTGIELKFYDQKLIAAALAGPADATAGEHDPSATLMLNTVTQGDGESQRDGRRLRMKSITVHGVFNTPAQTNSTTVDVAPLCFVALVLDTQANGAILASENVFTNPGANGVTAAQPFINLQFKERFKILKTYSVQFPQAEATFDGTNLEIGGMHKPWVLHKNLNNMPMTFSGTTETITNITDNALHIVAWCNNTTAAPTISYHSRLRFTG